MVVESVVAENRGTIAFGSFQQFEVRNRSITDQGYEPNVDQVLECMRVVDHVGQARVGENYGSGAQPRSTLQTEIRLATVGRPELDPPASAGLG